MGRGDGKKGSAGAAYGRLGGKLSGGSRSREALAAVPKVTVVARLPTSSDATAIMLQQLAQGQAAMMAQLSQLAAENALSGLLHLPPSTARWATSSATRAFSPGTSARCFAPQLAAQARTTAAVCKAKADVAIVTGAFARLEEAPAPLPHQTGRATAEDLTHSRYGCVVTSQSHIDALAAREAKVAAAKAAKQQREVDFWEGKRDAILAAKDALASAVSPSALKLDELKMIIISRTGKGPKAKKKEDMIAEAERVLVEQTSSLLPPNPRSGRPVLGERNATAAMAGSEGAAHARLQRGGGGGRAGLQLHGGWRGRERVMICSGCIIMTYISKKREESKELVSHQTPQLVFMYSSKKE